MKWSVSFFGMYLLIAAILAGMPGVALSQTMPGTVEGEGTHFQITDSEYLKITLDSTESVKMRIVSVPEWISYNIATVSEGMTTTLAISGLAPSTTYYLYRDGQKQYTQIITDAAGRVSYAQDLAAPHIAYIFPTPQDMTTPQLPGKMEGEGTHFVVTDSDYLNVTVDSIEPVTIRLSSISNTITMDITAITAAASTQLTIGSLLPNTTYYKYEDGLHNGVAFTTDAAGSYTYTQDLSSAHHIMILTHHSTKFIKDDATGGDCASIGIWDAATKTCALTTDLTETVQIDSDGITLDGNGHSITGSGTGQGVYGWERSGLTIKNLHISGFTTGIHLDYYNPDYYYGPPYSYWMKNNTITNNTITGSNMGIVVSLWADNTVVTNNIITGCNVGIDVMWGGSVRVENNYVDSEGGSHGALFAWIRLNVTHNFFYNAAYDGVWAVNGASGDVAYNTIQNNGRGSTIYYYTWVHVHDNNFIDNGRQALEGNNSYNYYYKNYWSDYATPAQGCYDDNADGYCDAPKGIEDWGGTVVEFDNYPRTQKIGSARPDLPVPPVADAGPDQTLECPATEAFQITLNGSGSFDPNGDALTYAWSVPSGTATGVSPTVTLPRWGTWVLPLTVASIDGTDTDEVVITAGDTIAPTTTASIIGVKDMTGTYTTDVTVIVTAEDTCTGVGEIHYTINGVETVKYDVKETSFTLTDNGTYYVTYWSVDKAGKTSSTGSATFNATPAVGGGGAGGGGGGYSCIDLDLLTENADGELVYSTDGGLTWQAYTNGLNICSETPTVTVSYGYRAPSNNVENVKTLVINIQKTTLSLILPDNITAEATSAGGAAAYYSASAPGAVLLGCTPVSGSVFSLGSTSVSCTASDSIGNSTSGGFMVTVVDTTAPRLSLPADITTEAAGPDGADVSFEAAANDLVDGVFPATCSPPSGASFAVGTTPVACSATDSSGNQASGTFTVTVMDATPPVTAYAPSGTIGGDGWYVSDVTVTLISMDAASGVAEMHYILDGVENVVSGNTASFTVSADGTHSLTYWARDAANNTEGQHGPVNFKIDKTPPVVTVTGLTNGASYPVCTPPTPGYSVEDPISGPANHYATLEGGNANGVGGFIYTVTATDNAGNTAAASLSYRVVYSFGGFLTPVILDKPFRLGSTIPVKFALTNGCGAYVPNATARLSLAQLSGTEPAGDPIDGSTNVPDSGNFFRYAAEDNQYIYNLSTGDSLFIGFWRAAVALDDGETYSVELGIK